MDDKVFNLLEKMYSEMNDKFDKVHDELKSLKDGQTKISMAIEHDIKPSIKMLYDEVVSVKEKLVEHDMRFDKIESKIESQDVEISVIKRVK